MEYGATQYKDYIDSFKAGQTFKLIFASKFKNGVTNCYLLHFACFIRDLFNLKLALHWVHLKGLSTMCFLM